MANRHSSSKTVPFHAHVTKGGGSYGSVNYGVSYYEGDGTHMGFRYREDAEEAAARINKEWGDMEVNLDEAAEHGMDGVTNWYECEFPAPAERKLTRWERGRWDVEAYPVFGGIVVNLLDLGDVVMSDADAKKLADMLNDIIDPREV